MFYIVTISIYPWCGAKSHAFMWQFLVECLPVWAIWKQDDRLHYCPYIYLTMFCSPLLAIGWADERISVYLLYQLSVILKVTNWFEKGVLVIQYLHTPCMHWKFKYHLIFQATFFSSVKNSHLVATYLRITVGMLLVEIRQEIRLRLKLTSVLVLHVKVCKLTVH